MSTKFRRASVASLLFSIFVLVGSSQAYAAVHHRDDPAPVDSPIVRFIKHVKHLVVTTLDDFTVPKP